MTAETGHSGKNTAYDNVFLQNNTEIPHTAHSQGFKKALQYVFVVFSSNDSHLSQFSAHHVGKFFYTTCEPTTSLAARSTVIVTNTTKKTTPSPQK